MTIDELINSLEGFKKTFGGDCDVFVFESCDPHAGASHNIEGLYATRQAESQTRPSVSIEI